ncbi:YbaK family protein [Neobacillus terrae]|uniref:YbaK family protein n=1 Tax=Neobacillus terrae TaxID=3034837 RepID=UPI00140B5930|nr:YbaK family protein [Neobacillus terrae]NHM33410.1 YbaK family protein [Neobacillus terrae]
MNLITTLQEKRKERQIKYERSVLKDLSINVLKERVQKYFGSFRLTSSLLMNSGIQEACYDVALESYLLGANLSKFGVYGESVTEVKRRCTSEEKHLIDTLYNFFLYWSTEEDGVLSESLYYLCEQYVEVWWMEGFEKGKKRQKLRLH